MLALTAASGRSAETAAAMAAAGLSSMGRRMVFEREEHESPLEEALAVRSGSRPGTEELPPGRAL